MNNDVIAYKQELLKSGVFEKVSTAYQYKCQYCPFCGDAKYHMYVKIKTDDDSPVLYNCKKCNASGCMNREFLNYYGLEDIKIAYNGKKGRRYYNTGKKNENIDKVSDKDSKKSFVGNINYADNAMNYIGERLGVTITEEDLKVCQYVGYPKMYAKEYLGMDIDNVYKGRCWFKLTNGGLIGRNMYSDEGMRWYRLKSDKLIGGGLYQLSLPVDTGKEINAIITEGIMDGIGMWKHGGVDNGVYISCMGSDYERGIEHLIDLGLFGDTVNVGVYVDGDVDITKLWFDKYLMMLFKHVDIYRNTLEKDYGVKGDLINIERVRRIV
jgi:hypothetical protein